MPTITESFTLAIPTHFNDQESPDAHISGPSTRDSAPPWFWISVSFRDIWSRYATTVLDRVNLSQHRLASWDDSMRFNNEADVAEAAALYLMNPVQLALSAHHRGAIMSLSQVTQGSARCDKAWYRDTGNVPACIALLDYKRVGTIRGHEFDDAKCPPGSWDQFILFGEARGSFLLDNASILLKQAVNYADQYRTKYVAFFDWKTLLLLVLADQEGDDGGRFFYATIETDRRKMRRALLGFLERSYQSSKHGEQTLSSLMPSSTGASGSGSGGGGRGRR